jgi:hypothetical protein
MHRPSVGLTYGPGQRATLIPVNGRRLTPSGSAGSFIDVRNIPLSTVPQTMRSTCIEFSRQSRLQVMFDFNILSASRTSAVNGTLTALEALATLLSGTHLLFECVSTHTVAVVPRNLTVCWHTYILRVYTRTRAIGLNDGETDQAVRHASPDVKHTGRARQSLSLGGDDDDIRRARHRPFCWLRRCR